MSASASADPGPLNEIRTVCGGLLQEPEKYPSAEHRGRRLYFCHFGCLRAFQTDPDRFLAGEIDHPPEEC